MAKIMSEMQSERAGETDEQTYARAMRDPEIQEIMADPLMRQILSDSQQDPRALQDHMKNPMVSRYSTGDQEQRADMLDRSEGTEIDQRRDYTDTIREHRSFGRDAKGRQRHFNGSGSNMHTK